MVDAGDHASASRSPPSASSTPCDTATGALMRPTSCPVRTSTPASAAARSIASRSAPIPPRTCHDAMRALEVIERGERGGNPERRRPDHGRRPPGELATGAGRRSGRSHTQRGCAWRRARRDRIPGRSRGRSTAWPRGPDRRDGRCAAPPGSLGPRGIRLPRRGRAAAEPLERVAPRSLVVVRVERRAVGPTAAPLRFERDELDLIGERRADGTEHVVEGAPGR